MSETQQLLSKVRSISSVIKHDNFKSGLNDTLYFFPARSPLNRVFISKIHPRGNHSGEFLPCPTFEDIVDCTNGKINKYNMIQ